MSTAMTKEETVEFNFVEENMPYVEGTAKSDDFNNSIKIHEEQGGITNDE